MVLYKSLFVALAAISTVAAGPCKPSTTSAGLSTTTAVIEESTSSQASAIEEATTTTVLEEHTSTQTSTIEESTTATTGETKAAVPTTTIDAALTTATTAADTTTTAETTTTAAETTTTAVAPSGVCGITGYFLQNQELNYLYNPGKKANVKQCLEACAAYDGCEVIAFYTERSSAIDIDTCEFFSGALVTDGEDTTYEWYEVGCLDSMQD